MDPKIFKVLQVNRVRLLNLDYFDLTAPLLSKEILPTWKHKEIKNEGKTDKARVDGLLDWIEECNTPNAFVAFLEGVKNCQQGNLAKKLKKEAEGLFNGPIRLAPVFTGKKVVKKPVSEKAPLSKVKLEKGVTPNKVKPATPKPGTSFNSENGMKGTPLPGDLKAKQIKPKKPKPPKPSSSISSGLTAANLESIVLKRLNAINSSVEPSGIVFPPGTPKQKKPKKPKTPTSATIPAGNSTITLHADTSFTSAGPTPSSSSTSAKKPAPTPKQQSFSTSKIAKVTLPKSLQGSPFKTKRKLTKLEKAMTFEEVVEKQKNARQKFHFSNNAACAKEFNPQGSIFYEGCSFKSGGGICSKKVERKGGEYICKDEHKTDSPFMIPRINAIFTDGTADLELTFFKQDVEALVSIAQPDLLKLDQASIHFACSQVVNQNFHVEVECTKLDKREAKKLGGKRWNNVATILHDDEPAIKKKK